MPTWYYQQNCAFLHLSLEQFTCKKYEFKIYLESVLQKNVVVISIVWMSPISLVSLDEKRLFKQKQLSDLRSAKLCLSCSFSIISIVQKYSFPFSHCFTASDKKDNTCWRMETTMGKIILEKIDKYHYNWVIHQCRFVTRFSLIIQLKSYE